MNPNKLKILFAILCFISESALYGQSDSSNAYSYEHHKLVYDISYGTYFYNNSFKNQVNTFNEFEISKPLKTFGISYSYFTRNNKWDDNVMMSYSHVIPQEVLIDSSVTGALNGFNFGLYLVSRDLTSNSKFSSILFGVGFNTGRLRLKSKGYRSQKNPFFAPAVFFNPRIYINRLTVSLRTEYQLDISKKSWRSLNFTKQTEKLHLDPFGQSALIVNASLGWTIL